MLFGKSDRPEQRHYNHFQSWTPRASYTTRNYDVHQAETKREKNPKPSMRLRPISLSENRLLPYLYTTHYNDEKSSFLDCSMDSRVSPIITLGAVHAFLLRVGGNTRLCVLTSKRVCALQRSWSSVPHAFLRQQTDAKLCTLLADLFSCTTND